MSQLSLLLCLAAATDAPSVEEVRQRIASYAENTQRALRFDWYAWDDWCADRTRHADHTPRPSWPIRGPSPQRAIRWTRC